MDVVVTLARSKILTGDLLDLSVGDIITTEKEVNTPLELAVQNVPKYNATPGAFKGKKAVQIESAIEKKQFNLTAQNRSEPKSGSMTLDNKKK